MASTVADSWARINGWLKANGLPERFFPPPGVSDATIEQAETVMGLQLPTDLRESYRIHDGSYRGAYLMLFERGYMLPLGPGGEGETVVGTWEAWRANTRDLAQYGEDKPGKVRGPIRRVYWSERWVPLTCDWESNSVCVDLDPVKHGCVGQVIMRWRGADAMLLATSWGEWLAQYADRLEAQQYRLQVQYDWLAVVRRASEPDE